MIWSPVTALEQAEASGIAKVDSKNKIPYFTEDEKLEFDVDGSVDAHDWSRRLMLQNRCVHEPDAIVARRVKRVGPLSIGKLTHVVVYVLLDHRVGSAHALDAASFQPDCLSAEPTNSAHIVADKEDCTAHL